MLWEVVQEVSPPGGSPRKGWEGSDYRERPGLREEALRASSGRGQAGSTEPAGHSKECDREGGQRQPSARNQVPRVPCVRRPGKCPTSPHSGAPLLLGRGGPQEQF